MTAINKQLRQAFYEGVIWRDGISGHPVNSFIENTALERWSDAPQSMNDPVNHPSHYTTGKIEVIAFIQDQQFGYLAGNVVKYVARHQHKGKPLEDLQKARWYLDRLIQDLSNA